jgi:hypothetical protein
MQCSVCVTSRAVYKCKLCREPYCSAKCNSEHRGVCTRRQSEDDTSQQDRPQPAPSSRVERDDDETDLFVLRAPQLAALANDPTLRKMLKSHELRALLTTIDTSRSRLDALAAAQHNIPEFRDFCRHVIGIVEKTG